MSACRQMAQSSDVCEFQAIYSLSLHYSLAEKTFYPSESLFHKFYECFVLADRLLNT